MLNSQTLCNEWLSNKEKEIKPGTLDKYTSIVNKYLVSLFDQYELSDLNEDILRHYLSDLVKQGLSSSSLQSIKNVIKSIYSTYENQYGLHHIDFSLVKVDRNVVKKEELNDKQYGILHDYCLKEVSALNLSILLAMDTGMMLGEIIALRYDDIDEQIIHISKRAQRTKKNEVSTKTLTQVFELEYPVKRDIVIPYCLNNYLDAYCKNKDKDNYLLTNNKVLMDQKTLQRGLNKIGDKLGFEITYQGLRNTFKQRCIDHCVDTQVIMQQLGITSLTLNLDKDKSLSNERKQQELSKVIE